ncbi:MAG: hypothetical protein JRD69_01775 [Deltaproteobacteria bacterium]|nr:hypothetical protein [Deltaproteobacteria bacterium]
MYEKSKALHKTVAQAANLLLSSLSLQEKTVIANMQKNNLTDLHFSLGRFIRNEFQLLADLPLFLIISMTFYPPRIPLERQAYK